MGKETRIGGSEALKDHLKKKSTKAQTVSVKKCTGKENRQWEEEKRKKLKGQGSTSRIVPSKEVASGLRVSCCMLGEKKKGPNRKQPSGCSGGQHRKAPDKGQHWQVQGEKWPSSEKEEKWKMKQNKGQTRAPV